MNKSEFVESLRTNYGVTKKVAQEAVDMVLDNLCSTLSSGEPVTFPGHFKFDIVERGARTGHNPQTGETIEIPARKALKVRPSNGLKAAISSL